MTFNTPINTGEQSIDRVLRAGLPVVLVFWRGDSGPSRALEPVLARLAAAYAGKALIARVDATDNPRLVERYRVTHLPGLIFVKDGSALAQAHGAASEAALRDWLEHLVAGRPQPALPSGPSTPLTGTPENASTPQYRNGHTPQPPSGETSSAPVTLTDATFDQIVGGNAQPVLVDFWAPWCGPCRAVAPTVERLAQEFAGRALVAKLNVDDNPRIAQRFGISSIPALYIFKRGQVVERLVGAQPADVLRQALARHADH